MKNYKQQKNGYLRLNNTDIPNVDDCSAYIEALEKVEAGEATIDAYEGSARESQDQSNATAAQQKADRKQAMLTGIEFEEVMCSATSEDMYGLSAIKDWIKAGNSVNFEFKNDNKLTINQDNIDAFELVWVPFRASFF